MFDGAIVSRKELFDLFDDNTPSLDKSPLNTYQNYGFEEIVISSPPLERDEVELSTKQVGDNEEDNDNNNLIEFQLFGGDGVSTVNLVNKPEEFHHSRPVSYYIFQPNETDRCSYRLAAISGEDVLQESEFWQEIASKNPAAPDINKDWVPKKRRCRPGKSARANKKQKKERKEQEEKMKREKFKRQRRDFKFKKFDKPRIKI